MKTKLFRAALGLVLITIISAGVVSFLLWRNHPKTNDRESIELFKEVVTIISNEYVEKVDPKKLMESAITGMLASLDPHSAYMPADSFKEMRIQMSGEFGGLGIEISLKDNRLTVISPIEDTPAYRAGIKANDYIFKIDDKPTRGLSITDAVNRMRGEKGTRVTLTILREGSPKPLIFHLTRDIIKTRSLKSRTIEPGFGYIRLAHFQETTGPEFTRALKSLHEQNSGMLKGLVIDLRNNPGGLLNQAVEVADHFIGEGFGNGLVVYTEGRIPTSRMKLTTKIGEKEPHYPIVVLINGGSASAAEILAGAFQDHRRAVILGTQSFGKGSVQSVIPLRDKAGLKLTTARYYTPSGRSIQAKGITPDIIVNQIDMSKAVEQPDNHLRENDLEGKIAPTTSGHPAPAVSPPPTEGQETKKTPLKEVHGPVLFGDLKSDYQLSRAMELLHGLDLMAKRSLPGR